MVMRDADVDGCSPVLLTCFMGLEMPSLFEGPSLKVGPTDVGSELDDGSNRETILRS